MFPAVCKESGRAYVSRAIHAKREVIFFGIPDTGKRSVHPPHRILQLPWLWVNEVDVRSHGRAYVGKLSSIRLM